MRSLRTNAFAGARELLYTSGNDLRIGSSAGPRRELFAAFPSWDGDTLCFVPFPLAVIGSADPVALRRLPRTVVTAAQHQRRLFRDIAVGWAASEPRSADAAHALALSLFLLGEPSAMDTLVRAESLATDAAERQRVQASDVWMRVQFALPTDLRALRTARLLADSLLKESLASHVDPQLLASIAALTGHAFEAVALDERVARATRISAPASVSIVSRTLELYAAFGGPADSLRVFERRTDSLIRAFEPPTRWEAARLDAFERAAIMAFPESPLASVPSFSASRGYLLEADAAFLRGDTLRVRQLLDHVRSVREAFALPEITLDALYPESWLLASMGDIEAAERWLDPTLMRIRLSSTLTDAVRAAMLVRAMAFRAELAARAGDKQTAAEWAAAVAELWAGRG